MKKGVVAECTASNSVTAIMEMQMQGKNKPHVVAFAIPFQGHMNPMLQLVRKIAEAGAVVTFVDTEAAHAELLKANGGRDPILESRDALGIDLRSAQISDGLPPQMDRNLHRLELVQSMRTAMGVHVENLMRELLQASPPVSCFLTDTFVEWAGPVAKKLGVRFVSFFTQSVAVYSLYLHHELLAQNGHFPFPQSVDCNEKIIDYIPGLPAMAITELTSFQQEADLSTPMVRLFIDITISLQSMLASTTAQWVLSNTVEELESITVSALRALGKPVLSVGPLLPSEFTERFTTIENPKTSYSCRASFLPESDISAWLDSKPRESVVYISFGSFAYCSKEVLEEFAMGLLESKQSFIWVLRPNIGTQEDSLPEEFIQGSKNQGVVVNWCNQLEVLRHPSVGAFLTHCGWNSVLEGLWLGVPMMGFPLTADQYTNCWLLSEIWGVGKSVGRVSCRSSGDLRGAVKRNEIADTVREFMANEQQQLQIRMRVQWAKDVVRKSITAVDGSSNKNFKVFVDDLFLCTGDSIPDKF